jgi:hypothetical protein
MNRGGAEDGLLGQGEVIAVQDERLRLCAS